MGEKWSHLKYKRFYGAAALLGTDHHALSGDGVVDIRDPAAGADGPLHDEIPDDAR